MLTEAQEAKLRQYRGSHRSIADMARLTGIRDHVIRAFFAKPRDDYWTGKENAILSDGLKRGLKSAAIAEFIPGRTPYAVYGRIRYLKNQAQRRIKTVGILSFKVPADVIAERDKRNDEYRTNTQVLMGDPTPSRSALGRALSD